MIAFRLSPLLVLIACTLSGPLQPAPPARAERIAAECALLAQAAAVMADTGTPAPDSLREGCPGVTARDARPLAQQTASLRAATNAPLPAQIAPGSRGDQVFRRMITRGVPVSVATALVPEPEFRDAAR